MCPKAVRKGDVDAVRRALHAWKEILVLVKKLRDWDQRFYYPVAIVVIITFKFLIWWYLDPTLVVAWSLSLLAFILGDHILPFVTPMIFYPLTKEQETDFDVFCEAIINVKYSAKAFLAAFLQLRSNDPTAYFTASVIGLLLSAWAGSALGDKLVCYFVVIVFATLYPKMESQGNIDYFIKIIAKLPGYISIYVQDLNQSLKPNESLELSCLFASP